MYISDMFEKNPISPWVYPGLAETKVLIQTTRNPHIPSPHVVIDVCCELGGITLEEFWSDSRLKKIIEPRRIAGFLLFHFCGWSFVKAAKFVKRDRTSVMHHTRQLEAWMSVDKDERDKVFEHLVKLEIINTSSSGTDWYYAWAHEQLKQPETYLELAHKDCADALREIVELNHMDGRALKDKVKRAQRNSLLTMEMNKMNTIGDYARLMERYKNQKKGHKAIAEVMNAKYDRKEKFDVPVPNKYDKY
jgi:hypothetical protein